MKEADRLKEAHRLRQEASRALRLSQQIGDRQATATLAAYVADLLERAEAMERGGMPPPERVPSQQPTQQQQIQPKKEE
jgi:hypothetical protein